MQRTATALSSDAANSKYLRQEEASSTVLSMPWLVDASVRMVSLSSARSLLTA
jgi:hypothetical protein